uniref:Uncharacterized protein n=1 Tax=Siphoviridae sp. ct3r22 TaxID=2825325 RepID=A0A8S5V1C4_9CAUD|nr:MAG TPA: hypothetical protein [Siphoviridae sp. ct3r22]
MLISNFKVKKNVNPKMDNKIGVLVQRKSYITRVSTFN